MNLPLNGIKLNDCNEFHDFNMTDCCKQTLQLILIIGLVVNAGLQETWNCYSQNVENVDFTRRFQCQI